MEESDQQNPQSKNLDSVSSEFNKMVEVMINKIERRFMQALEKSVRN